MKKFILDRPNSRVEIDSNIRISRGDSQLIEIEIDDVGLFLIKRWHRPVTLSMIVGSQKITFTRNLWEVEVFSDRVPA